MKDLVKPNNLEDDYQRAEQFCESGFESECGTHKCKGVYSVRSIEDTDDILF